MMHYNIKRHYSFTLIEVVVSVTLLVTILGILFLSTGTVMSSWEQMERHSHFFEELLSLDRSVDTLLGNVIPFRWPTEEREAQAHLVFVGEKDRVIFSYIHAFNRLEDGAIRTCYLTLEENDLIAYYVERPPFPEDITAENVWRSVLAHNIHAISFSYADLDEKDLVFSDTWDEDKDYLPLGITIHVEWLNGRSYQWLRRTAGSSYYERWGKWEQKTKEL